MYGIGASAMSFTEDDCAFLRALLIVPPGVTREADEKLERAIQEPVGIVGRVAAIRHPDGTITRRWFLTQSDCIEWLRITMRPQDGDEMEIASTDSHIQPKTPKDYEHLCLTHEDRVFLAAIGSRIHMLGFRDAWLWKERDRRASGEPQRHFDQLFRADMQEFDRRRKR